MMTTDAPLAALLDTLLPGEDDWPAAGRHGLSAKTHEMAALVPGGPEALASVLEALPAGFADMPGEDRETILKDIESHLPDAFETTVSAAYNAYYTDPDVRNVIEKLTGYENRPPQPQGYDLPPFDESLLDQVKARGPIWRPVPEE